MPDQPTRHQNPQAHLPSTFVSTTCITESDSWVLFVSGLRVGANPDDELAVQLLLDYLTGYAGGDADHEAAAKISQVIVLGNSLHRFHSPEDRRDYRRM